MFALTQNKLLNEFSLQYVDILEPKLLIGAGPGG